MSDIIDDANDRADMDLSLALAAQRRRVTDVLPIPKECQNDCGTENEPGARFCCTDCREMFEARQKQRRRAGDT